MRRAPTRSPKQALPSIRTLLAGALLGAMPLAALPLTAQAQSQAQIKDSTPRWVVITKDDAPVRCDDFERFYKVASLDAGSVLRADGQSTQWARVVYPIGVPALVPAADARVIDDKTIELTTPSRLRAPSAILGIAGSWRSLYSEAVPQGTRLEVIEKEIGANNEIAAYRVKAPHPPVAPEPPYAYVKLEFVRDATPAEAQAHIKALSAIPGASPVPVNTARIIPDAVEVVDDRATPTIEPVVPAPKTEIATPSQARPAPTTPRGTEDVVELTDAQFAGDEGDRITRIDQPGATNVPDSTNSLLEPMVLPGQEDLAAPSVRSNTPDRNASDQAVTPIQNGAPIAQSAPAPTPELAPDPSSIEDLELALTSARRLPKEALDEALDELHAEFQRTLSAQEAKGQDEKVLEALRRRVAWLDLRIQTRDQRRALDEALRSASSREQAIASGVQTWQSGRAYSMVGRLASSAVYNGDRLPLMYRVQSIDPLTGPRTIGYVRPNQGDRLDSRLGQIVGIIGATTDDDALSLRIIRPERVDVLDTSAFANVPTD